MPRTSQTCQLTASAYRIEAPVAGDFLQYFDNLDSRVEVSRRQSQYWGSQKPEFIWHSTDLDVRRNRMEYSLVLNLKDPIMPFSRWSTVLLLSFVLSSPLQAAEPVYTPTEQYHRLNFQGWTVLNPELDQHPQLRSDTLELLDNHLCRITRKIPQPALNRLREQRVWVEYQIPKQSAVLPRLSALAGTQWLARTKRDPLRLGTLKP